MNEHSQFWQKKNLVIIVTSCVILSGLVVGLWFFMLRDTGLIPRKYARGLDITLYYPTLLPDGYTVDRQSFQRKENTLIFSITAPGGRNIAVSQQAAPPDATVKQTTPSPIAIPGEKNFYTGIGQAHISLWGDKYVSDITTAEGTWIILNATGFTTSQTMAVAKSFTKLP